MWVNKYIDDCTDEDLNDRDFIASVVDRAIFHFAINSICNLGDNKDAMPIEQCTFDVETKNDLPSTVQLFYEESRITTFSEYTFSSNRFWFFNVY